MSETINICYYMALSHKDWLHRVLVLIPYNIYMTRLD